MIIVFCALFKNVIAYTIFNEDFSQFFRDVNSSAPFKDSSTRPRRLDNLVRFITRRSYGTQFRLDYELCWIRGRDDKVIQRENMFSLFVKPTWGQEKERVKLTNVKHMKETLGTDDSKL